MAYCGFWSELDGAFKFMNDVVPGSENLLCFSLATTDRVVHTEDGVLLKVLVKEAAFCDEGQVFPVSTATFQASSGFAILRIRSADYETVARHAGELRVLQAPLFCKDATFVIDCITSPACLAGSVQLRADESLQMAELFSGGFMGWSRAGFCVAGVWG